MMKTILRLITIACLSLFVAACGGSEGNDGPTPGNGDLELTPSTRKITTSRYDQVKFTVTYEGKNVTAGATIREERGEFVKGGIFTSETAGKYTFRASYKGNQSDPVNIEVIPDSVFQKNLLMQQYTSVECVNCPAMTDNINYMRREYPGRLEVMALHVYLKGVVKDSMQVHAYAGPLAEEFGVAGCPVVVLDQERIWSNEGAVAEMDVKDRLAKKGTVGIAIDTKLEGRHLDIKVKVKSTEFFEHPCRVAVLTVENNIRFKQLNKVDGQEIWQDNYIHNHVVRKYLTDVWGDLQEKGAIERGKEFTRNYEYEFVDNSQIPSEVNMRKPENTDVLVYVTDAVTKEVLNCRLVKVGESADYQYVKN